MKNPIRWIIQIFRFDIKQIDIDTEARDPNDNQYQRMKFQYRQAGGINGQLFRRLNRFNDPQRLDEED